MLLRLAQMLAPHTNVAMRVLLARQALMGPQARMDQLHFQELV